MSEMLHIVSLSLNFIANTIVSIKGTKQYLFYLSERITPSRGKQERL